MVEQRRFSFGDGRTVLQRTPAVLETWLRPLPPDLLEVDEGPGTWSPIQVLRHLVWGEVDDWVPRVRLILEKGSAEAFKPFDRELGFARYAAWSLEELLAEFARLRAANLEEIDRLALTSDRLNLEGRHPELGRVTMEQLLATWVTHDLAHVAQIARVLTRHYGEFIGPWRAYFSLLE
jgi:DinB superfamily